MKLEKNPTWMCVVAVALTDGHGRWLMHRRPDDKHHGGLWEFPGGKVERGETPAFALIREIEEELGLLLDPADLRPLAFAEQPGVSGETQIVIMLYTCGIWQGNPAALEGGAIGWFSFDEIAKLPRPPLDIDLSHSLFKNCAS